MPNDDTVKDRPEGQASDLEQGDGGAGQAVALKKYQTNPRVKYVRIVVSDEACPACQAMEGAYPKDGAPPLPVEACSHPLGCRCFYLPFLTDIYP